MKGAFALFAVACGPAPAPEDTSPDPAPCTLGDADAVGTVDIDGLVELSGLVRFEGSFVAHNDSGDGPRLFAFGETGDFRWGATLDGAPSVDWEDVARWERADGAALVVADVGDNGQSRDDVALIVAERDGDGFSWVSRPLDRPGGPADVEAVAVVGDEVWMVTKDLDGGRVWVGSLDGDGEIALADVGAAGPLDGSLLATGLDVFVGDDVRVALRTYTHVHLWCAATPEGALTALRAAPDASLPMEIEQAEAVSFDDAGGALFTVAEGAGAPLWRIPVGG